MGLLGRKAERSGTDRDQRDLDHALAEIAAFWAWWSTIHEQVVSETAQGHEPSPERNAEITEHVDAIGKGLAWELSQPDPAAHQLVVTAGGTAELRSLAQRWAQAAPDHPGWSYLPARPASPAALGDSVVVDGRRISPADTEIAARVNQRRAVVDVIVYHPVFADLVDEQAREQIVTRTLDLLLGEDDVARWIGRVEIATERPLDGIPVGSLPTVVEQVSAMYAEPRWALLSGSTATGLPVVATVRFPLHQVDYPLADQHVAVVLPYRDRTEQRLPTEAALDALNEFEERLLAVIEPGAVLVGHETANGRRIMHVYQDAAAPVTEAVTELARSWRSGRASVAATNDPGWAHIAHLRP